MKLILNNASTLKGGSLQVALSFISECRKSPENEYHVVVSENLALQIKQEEYPDNFFFHVVDRRPAVGLVNFYKKMRWFERLALEVQPDCVVATGGHGYWTPARFPVVTGFNMPHYIYPESPFWRLQPLRKRVYWRVKKLIDFYFYGRVDALFVQTDDVRSRLAASLKTSRISTVSNTAHPAFFEVVDSSAQCLLPARDNRVRLLTVSGYHPHKNLEVIPKVLDCLLTLGRREFIFVVTLKDVDFLRMFPRRYHDSILNVGPLSVSKVPGLYRECDFMFLPTLLECFSASYAEAMATGKPIITSDMGFAHTVCRDAALYFDPMNPDDIAEKIMTMASSRELQSQLAARGNERLTDFGDSEARAEQILGICREVTGTGER